MSDNYWSPFPPQQEKPSANEWPKLVHTFPNSLARGWDNSEAQPRAISQKPHWDETPVAHRDHLLDNSSLGLLSLPVFPSLFFYQGSWDRLPNKLLVLKSLRRSLLLAAPRLR